LVLVESARLVTLTGPGGSGKTRLALHAAAELEPHFDRGAHFVDLSSLSDPSLVQVEIARSMGLIESNDRTPLETIKEFLRPRRHLLILDNFEQLLPAVSVVSELLSACPGLSIIVSSRIALRIDGEHEFDVPPLELPDLSGPASFARLSANSSVSLFVDRATAIRPSFRLTDENAAAVAEICARMDGLPLAIELASSGVRVLEPHAIAARLGDGLDLPRDGRRDRPARQQTLRNTIAWSHDLLPPDDQQVFRRLGVFANGFTLEAAEAVCFDTGEAQVPSAESLGVIVEHSLLRVNGDARRFSMLSTVREFAREHLDTVGETSVVARRHAEFYLRLAEAAQEHYLSADAVPWLHVVDADLDNFRAAMDWCLRGSGPTELGLRIASALSRYWQLRIQLREGADWLALALADGDTATARWRPKALVGAGWIAHHRGDSDEAAARFSDAAELSRRIGDRHGRANAIGDLGVIREQQGNYAEAERLMSESLELYRETGDREGEAARLRGLGSVACSTGDFERARRLLEEGLALCRELGGVFSTALALGALGLEALYRRDSDTALPRFTEALTLFRHLGHGYAIAWSLHYLGRVALLRGEHVRAAELLTDSLRRRLELGDWGGIAQCLEGLASVNTDAAHDEQAAQLLGAAMNLRLRIRSPLSPSERAMLESDVAATRSRLGEQRFEVGVQTGSRRAPESLVELAFELGAFLVSGGPPQGRSDHQSPPVGGVRAPGAKDQELTPREIEVATLVARGYRNREIAASLVIAERTAESHVRNILKKLELRTRADIATWVARGGPNVGAHA
jgi:non-specific serine/threonine protein kinase